MKTNQADKQQKSNVEVWVRLGIIIAFCFYWIPCGFEVVEKTGLFSDFIKIDMRKLGH
jgi:hypothetical protein